MTQKTAGVLPEESTSHGIALKFAEIFQNHYPRKPIIGMMEDLRRDIESYAASQTERLREENASLRKQLEEREPGFQKFSLMQEDPRSIALDSTEVSSSKQEIEQKPDEQEDVALEALLDTIDSLYLISFNKKLIGTIELEQATRASIFKYVSPLQARIKELEQAVHASERFRIEDAANHLDDMAALRNRLNAKIKELEASQNKWVEKAFAAGRSKMTFKEFKAHWQPSKPE